MIKKVSLASILTTTCLNAVELPKTYIRAGQAPSSEIDFEGRSSSESFVYRGVRFIVPHRSFVISGVHASYMGNDPASIIDLNISIGLRGLFRDSFGVYGEAIAGLANSTGLTFDNFIEQDIVESDPQVSSASAFSKSAFNFGVNYGFEVGLEFHINEFLGITIAKSFVWSQLWDRYEIDTRDNDFQLIVEGKEEIFRYRLKRSPIMIGLATSQF